MDQLGIFNFQTKPNILMQWIGAESSACTLAYILFSSTSPEADKKDCSAIFHIFP